MIIKGLLSTEHLKLNARKTIVKDVPEKKTLVKNDDQTNITSGVLAVPGDRHFILCTLSTVEKILPFVFPDDDV